MREKTIRVDTAKLIKARGGKKSAHIAGELGISKQRLWNYEAGLRDIPEPVFRQICQLYKVSMISLLPENNSSQSA